MRPPAWDAAGCKPPPAGSPPAVVRGCSPTAKTSTPRSLRTWPAAWASSWDLPSVTRTSTLAASGRGPAAGFRFCSSTWVRARPWVQGECRSGGPGHPSQCPPRPRPLRQHTPRRPSSEAPGFREQGGGCAVGDAPRGLLPARPLQAHWPPLPAASVCTRSYSLSVTVAIHHSLDREMRVICCLHGWGRGSAPPSSRLVAHKLAGPGGCEGRLTHRTGEQFRSGRAPGRLPGVGAHL